MKKLQLHSTISQYINKRSGIVAIVAAAVLIPTVTLATWGPQRPTYTIENAADKVVFNSITNNPHQGDERNFVQIKETSNTAPGGWKDELNVENGKEYWVRVYVHNNAKASLNLVATNTRVTANVPTALANEHRINGIVSADNATPQKVWDDVVLRSDKKFNIAYVNGSTRFINNIFTGEGKQLPDGITGSAGTQIGYDKIDGRVPGCFQYDGDVTFKIKIQEQQTANFDMDKKVRQNGTTEWKKSITAKPGTKVDYQVSYKNTGTVTQNNIIAIDKLPAGVSYQKGSTTLRNANHSNGNGLAVTSDTIVGAGLNLGSYTAGSDAYARFTATLPANDKLALCGPNTLRNFATVTSEQGTKESYADVVVTKENCGPTECKPGVPAGDAKCNTVTPAAALPTTGPAEVIAGLIGIAAITIGVVYYFKSRRELQDVLHDAQSQPTITKSTDKK
ncbi:DUF11 domain-containing protein [Candidatus Saccharibacteria bacterium]|nr:DUF11 domain-containing protein [Candidatus Saccharibacteria bacterium]MBH1973166.1 DUF11 domain-containing protein [Candidatus Saccharibacteria bacterium]MBH1990593.1 DUF11 domain-containing protein [Candidatus Saccharibacteria bacterium]